MTLTSGRVVPPAGAAAAPRVERIAAARIGQPPRVVERPIVDATLRANEILARAEAQAAQVLAEGRASLQSLYERTLEQARTQAATELAARTLDFAELEQRADERALDRLVALSRLLAERLLGETLAVDPTRVIALAESALKEARGARRITIIAHPADVPDLERALLDGKREHVTRIVADPKRARGHLRFETDIGVLDAELAPQLDRLAQRLREAIAHER